MLLVHRAAELSRTGSRRRRCAAPRAGTSARPPALGRPRPARAGPGALGPPLIYQVLLGTQLVLHRAVLLGDPIVQLARVMGASQDARS